MDLPQLDTIIEHEIQQERRLSNEGIEKVNAFIAFHVKMLRDDGGSAEFIAEWITNRTDSAWQTEDGNYCKRIGRRFHYLNMNNPGYWNFDGVDLSKLGSIASKYSLTRAKYTFDITREITWNAGDFGDRSSCFWTSNARAKDLLMDNGGMALRFYNKTEPPGYTGVSRSWLVDKGDRLVLFNAYGHYELHTQAEVLSKYLGLEHKLVCLYNHGQDHGLLYINGDGRLIGKPPMNTDILDLELGDEPEKEENWYECGRCGGHYGEDEGGNVDGDGVCDDCYSDANECYQCGDRTFESLTEVYIDTRRTKEFCERCANRKAIWCEYHDKWYIGNCPDLDYCDKHEMAFDDCNADGCAKCIEEADNAK